MLLIASDKPKITESWRHALEKDFEIYVRDAYDRRALDLYLRKCPIEVLLLDIDLLTEDGVNELSEILQSRPDLHVILFAPKKEDREEISAILFGAKAYCQIDIEPTLIIKVIKTVLKGELWVDRKFINRLLTEIEDITHSRHSEAMQLEEAIAAMTPREGQIASLVATGATNRRIAEKLSISERTVKAHLGVIFRKIGIKDRLQLALYINRYQQISRVWHPK